MGFSIDDFRANFQAGARSYLFYYRPMFPAGVAGADTQVAQYLVRAARLPSTVSEELMVNWQGMDYKVAGKTSFTDWSVTFNVDVDSKIQTMFLNWKSLIHDPTTNIYSLPTDYMVDQQIDMLDLNGNPTCRYKLIGAWAKEVGEVSLDYSNNDIAQFDVTFTYVYHIMDKAVYGAPTAFA